MLVDVADGREVGIEVEPYRNGVIDARLPAPDEDVVARSRLGAPGPRRLPRGVPRRGATPGRRLGRRPGPGHRDRHRLHGVHDAPDDDRRHAAVLPRRIPAGPARVGQALEASRRAARGGHDQPRRARARATVARALRRQDLVGVVLPEGAPDPARGARRLSRRRPADRGRRLGGLAADRPRDAEQLHGRLQGALVGRRRLPGASILRGARARLRRGRRREAVAHDRADRRSRRRADRAGRRLDRPPARHGGRRRQRRCPCLGPGCDRHRTRHAGRDHGDEHLPRRPRGDGAGDRRDVRRRRRRRGPGLLRVRGRPGGRRRHVRLVRRRSRAAAVSRRGAKPRASASTRSWPRRRRRSARESRGCSRSTGGTATGPCWSMPTCRACWSG